MNDKTRLTVGYTAVGLALGLFLFPWFYILVMRAGVATTTDPLWAAIFFLVILGPGVLLGFLGPRRSRENAAT